jgi:hypothetical protein
VHAYWQQTLGVVQLQTPDAALNVLANGRVFQTTRPLPASPDFSGLFPMMVQD